MSLGTLEGLPSGQSIGWAWGTGVRLELNIDLEDNKEVMQ